MTIGRPWFKFHTQKWRGDQGLRSVSLAARGLWIECMAIMHEAKPYGHLLIAGLPVGHDILARAVGASLDEVSHLMVELEKAGVFSRTRSGIVYSRRMVKDEELSKKGRISVKRRYQQDAENKEENDEPSRVPSENLLVKKIEDKTKEKDKKENRPRKTEEPEGFAAFWQAYPRRVGKGQAVRAYATALGKIDAARLLEATQRFAADCRGKDPQYIPHPQTWLNGERWADERGTPALVGMSTAIPASFETPEDRRWMGRLDGWQQRGFWLDEWGPKPDQPGCRVPEWIRKQEKAA